MKKKIVAFCMLIALILGTVGGVSAFAEVSLEECDKCFQTTVNAFLQQEDVEGNKIKALRKPVYDIGLQNLGYVYEFELAEGKGYAIIICDDGNYIAQEFVPHTQSPYTQVGEEEMCVYINAKTYLKHNGTAFCYIETSEEVSAEVLEIFAENAVLYKQDSYPVQEKRTVTVNYTSYNSDNKYLSKRIPAFSNAIGLVGACAAVAGTNILGFYDRYYEDLIPNHTAGILAYGNYLYNLADSYVDDAMRVLYADMKGDGSGITETNFKSGLQTYCARKNLSCNFTSIMSSGTLNYNSVKQSIEENKPVALLLSTYTVCDVEGYSGYDRHIYNMFYGDHVMVGFGYCDIDYYHSDGSSSNYKFIYVAAGLGDPDDGFFNINYCTNINSAYKVYIH